MLRILLVILGITTVLYGSIINVPDDQATIQAGLNVATANDTVLVQPGIYTENLIWPEINGIKLIGADDTSNTIINGGSNGSVIYMFPSYSSTVTIDTTTIIKKFTITNGGNVWFGGGLHIRNGHPKLEALFVRNNFAEMGGGGIYCYNSSSMLTDVTISGNSTYSGNGGGVYCSDSSNLILTGVNISENSTSGGGGGIYCSDSSNLILTGVNISENSANGGGGIYCRFSSLILTDVTISENSANGDGAPGGGIYCYNSSSMLTDVTISLNSTENSGGGIYYSASSSTLTNVTISENTSVYSGSGIYCWTSSLTIIGAIISGNTSINTSGGGIFCHDSSPILTNMTISENSAQVNGGGMYFRAASNPILTSVTISGNTASYGGGIAWSGSSGTLTDVSISGNTANGGGGISCSVSSPTLTNVALLENTAIRGGGISCSESSNPILTDVIIRGNSATQNGGGIFCWTSAPALTSTTLSENIAINSGGGIYCIFSASPSIDSSTIINNSDGIYIVSGNPDVNNCNFIGNGMAIFNEDYSNIVDATGSWFGHSTGPYHPDQNPVGQGDSVNVYVNIDPWLNVPNPDTPPIPLRNLIVNYVGEDFVALSWEASQLPDLDYYRVYWGQDNAGIAEYTDSIAVSSADTSLIISNLMTMQIYHFAGITIDNDGNESCYSNEVLAIPQVIEIQNLNVAGLEDSLHLVDHTPDITYTFYSGSGTSPTAYHIQVSSHADFSDIDFWDTGAVTGSDTAITYAGSSLIDGQTYYLRVKAAAGDCWSDWALSSFRMNLSPSTPSLVSPVNNQIVEASVLFTIGQCEDAEGDSIKYQFFIFDNDSLGELVVSSGLIADTTWQSQTALAENSQYWWYAKAHDGYEFGEQSDTASFYMNTEPEVPNDFALLSPANNVTGLAPTVSFDWEIATDPDPFDNVTYLLQVSTDSAFVDIVYEINTDVTVGHQMTEELTNDTEYWWRVIATDTDSLSTESETFKFTVGYVSIAEVIALPTEYVLHQNFPNPFNPSTTLRYGIPENAPVSLVIYDLRGNTVKTMDSGTQVAGWYEHVWNGLDQAGQPVSTGLYLTRLQAGSYSKVIKMLYLK